MLILRRKKRIFADKHRRYEKSIFFIINPDGLEHGGMHRLSTKKQIHEQGR